MKMDTSIAAATIYWNRLIHSIWTVLHPLLSSLYSMKSKLLHCRCCCCLSVFILRVCVCVRACTNTCTQCHTSSRLFPQSYQCLFSYCEKLIAPAFFACPSLTKIYRCVYPINTSGHYVNWLVLQWSFWLALHHLGLFYTSFLLSLSICLPRCSYFDPPQCFCPTVLMLFV